MDWKTTLLFGYQAARSAHFAGQQLSLPLVDRWTSGRRPAPPPDLAEKRKLILTELRALLKRDSENIARGLYPVEVLKPESPLRHGWRYGRILWDGLKISQRRAEKDAHDLEQVSEDLLREVPEYYRRNFHYQTGGYLTAESADLYEHQVEILFAGGGDAMRRLLLPLMKEKFPGDGEGLRFLEMGAGTGRLSRFMKLAFPKARVTVSDLSWAYLQTAQKRLAGLDRFEFVQAPAEALPFRENSFDAVFSCFLFHELPAEVRRAVVEEGRRVLKPGGAFGLVDSLQFEDSEKLRWALEQFPRDFHEPFYRDYALKPMENVLSSAGFVETRRDSGFFAKALLASKA